MRVVAFDRIGEDVPVLMESVEEEGVGWVRDDGENWRGMNDSSLVESRVSPRERI